MPHIGPCRKHKRTGSGVASLTVPAVARRAGVSTPTVYRYLPDKETLVDAAADHVRASLGVPTSQDLPSDRTRYHADQREIYRRVATAEERTIGAIVATFGRGDASMTFAERCAGLAWEPPGRGTWEFDAGHQRRPYPKVMTDWVQEAFSEGFRAGFSKLGIPLDTMAVREVNGWVYLRPVPAGKDSGGSMPPKFVFSVLFRVVPELRRRLATAKTVFEERPWVHAANAWEARGRQAASDRQASLAAIDPTTCSDSDLASLLRDVTESAYRQWLAPGAQPQPFQMGPSSRSIQPRAR